MNWQPRNLTDWAAPHLCELALPHGPKHQVGDRAGQPIQRPLDVLCSPGESRAYRSRDEGSQAEAGPRAEVGEGLAAKGQALCAKSRHGGCLTGMFLLGSGCRCMLQAEANRQTHRRAQGPPCIVPHEHTRTGARTGAGLYTFRLRTILLQQPLKVLERVLGGHLAGGAALALLLGLLLRSQSRRQGFTLC